MPVPAVLVEENLKVTRIWLERVVGQYTRLKGTTLRLVSWRRFGELTDARSVETETLHFARWDFAGATAIYVLPGFEVREAVSYNTEGDVLQMQRELDDLLERDCPDAPILDEHVRRVGVIGNEATIQMRRLVAVRTR